MIDNIQFDNIYKNKRVLITGHSGFKGSWLKLWLELIGAKTTGFALVPNTNPNHYELLGYTGDKEFGDIRDRAFFNEYIEQTDPEIVFHLAAQPLVRDSYIEPFETFNTNVMGTINLLESCRKLNNLKAIVIVTSDKCYENKEWVWPYRENDPLGGYDPYSASKACTEIATSSYRNSFFNVDKYNKEHNVLIASVRAGNVIGGGDWSKNRIVPDIVKAIQHNKEVVVRNPDATRPWQHVLEPLSGYLCIGEKLLKGEYNYADAWNFGPSENNISTVLDLVNAIKKEWSQLEFVIKNNTSLHEAGKLNLDCSKAYYKLGWKSVLKNDEVIRMTIDWYKKFYLEGKIISRDQLFQYWDYALSRTANWIKSI